jgi:hypothetical protein
MLARYEEQLTRLQASLAGGINAGDSECSEAMRDLVETVTVSRDPTKAGGAQVEIAGRFSASKPTPIGSKACGVTVVAEVRYGLSPPVKNAEFSLCFQSATPLIHSLRSLVR